MKLFTINTINNFMDLIYNPFAKPFLEENPDITITNIMDDSLLKDTLNAGEVTKATYMKIYNYAQAAIVDGADGIVVTCTSINEATSKLNYEGLITHEPDSLKGEEFIPSFHQGE